jgi:hypothetical protein
LRSLRLAIERKLAGLPKGCYGVRNRVVETAVKGAKLIDRDGGGLFDCQRRHGLAHIPIIVHYLIDGKNRTAVILRHEVRPRDRSRSARAWVPTHHFARSWLARRACHSPRNSLGGIDKSMQFAGAVLDGWFALDLSENITTGLGSWSIDDVANVSKDGLA